MRARCLLSSFDDSLFIMLRLYIAFALNEVVACKVTDIVIINITVVVTIAVTNCIWLLKKCIQNQV